MLKGTIAIAEAVATGRTTQYRPVTERRQAIWQVELAYFLGDVMGRKFHCNPWAVADELEQLMRIHIVSIQSLVDFIELEIWLDEIPDLWKAR